METYTRARPVEPNDAFEAQRAAATVGLDATDIDEPLVALVADLNRLPHCFTLQCCYGHFVGEGDQDPRSLKPPPPMGKRSLQYRLAYVAFAISDDDRGRAFLEAVHDLRDLDPRYIQVGSADWFWDRQVNSFVIQIGPRKMRKVDFMDLDGKQVRHVSHVRTQLFRRFAALVERELEDVNP